jgi:hypothetical protein
LAGVRWLFALTQTANDPVQVRTSGSHLTFDVGVHREYFCLAHQVIKADLAGKVERLLDGVTTRPPRRRLSNPATLLAKVAKWFDAFPKPSAVFSSGMLRLALFDRASIAGMPAANNAYGPMGEIHSDPVSKHHYTANDARK